MALFTPEQYAKSALTRKTKLSAKERAFAEEFAKTRNGTQSALKVYDTTDYNTAGVIAHENLNKPKIRTEILALLKGNNIELEEILTIHKRNLLQDKHLPTSQKAVEDFYQILGISELPKADNSVKIAFVIEK